MSAMKEFPACCISAYENLKSDSGKGDNLKDMLDAVDHELTLYAEGQDGCITPREQSQCIRWKQKWKNLLLRNNLVVT